MEYHSQWLETPSGSGAEAPWPDMTTYHTEECPTEWSNDVFTSQMDQDLLNEVNSTYAMVWGSAELPHGAQTPIGFATLLCLTRPRYYRGLGL